MKDNHRKIGCEIRRNRKKIKMPINVLAEKMGVSIGLIHNWEMGKNEPRYSHIVKLDEFLNLGLLIKESKENCGCKKK